MADYFCDNCGSALGEDDVFCRECGERARRPVAAKAGETLASPVAVIVEEAEPVGAVAEPPELRAPAAKAAFCRNCGAPIEKDGLFCWECGVRVDEPSGVKAEDDEPAEEPADILPLDVIGDDGEYTGLAEPALDVRVCGNCGTLLDAGVIFCRECGERVGGRIAFRFEDDEPAEEPGDPPKPYEPAADALICDNCGAPLSNEEVLCPACGTWAVRPADKNADAYHDFDESHPNESICGNCGAPLAEEDIFCPACGVRVVFRDEPAIVPEEIDEPDEPVEHQPPEKDEAMGDEAADEEHAPRPSRVRQKKRSILREAAAFLLAGVLTILIVIACFHYRPNLQQSQINEAGYSQPEPQGTEEIAGIGDETPPWQSADQPEPAGISSPDEQELERPPENSEEYEYGYLVRSDDLPRDLSPTPDVGEEIMEDYAEPD